MKNDVDYQCGCCEHEFTAHLYPAVTQETQDAADRLIKACEESQRIIKQILETL
jgi:hypothetical protein